MAAGFALAGFGFVACVSVPGVGLALAGFLTLCAGLGLALLGGLATVAALRGRAAGRAAAVSGAEVFPTAWPGAEWPSKDAAAGACGGCAGAGAGAAGAALLGVGRFG